MGCKSTNIACTVTVTESSLGFTTLVLLVLINPGYLLVITLYIWTETACDLVIFAADESGLQSEILL